MFFEGRNEDGGVRSNAILLFCFHNLILKQKPLIFLTSFFELIHFPKVKITISINLNHPFQKINKAHQKDPSPPQ